MLTLGLSGAWSEGAAVLVEDGQVIAAAEEERMRGARQAGTHGPFPDHPVPTESVAWCLQKRGLTVANIDHIAYAWDPALLPEGRDIGHRGAGGLGAPWESVPLAQILLTRSLLQVDAPSAPKGPRARHTAWHYVPHQLAHVAGAYLASPFAEAAVLCLNGRGERASTTYAFAKGRDITIRGEVAARYSLGELYSRVTAHLGFRAGRDEARVAALAARGKPRYRDVFTGMITVKERGQYQIAEADLGALLGPARRPGEPLESRHEDMACSLQESLNETVRALAVWLKNETGARALALAGGVFQNCVVTSTLRDAGLFQDLWVQAAPGTAGTALGAALWVDQMAGPALGRYHMAHACLGPYFSLTEIEAAIRRSRLTYRRPPAIAVAVAARLASGKTVAWFQGGMEFGAQALGSRVILATPTDPAMVATINELKGRESYAPVASAILAGSVRDWLEDTQAAPFRSFISQVRSDKRARIPAATHVDGSARVQTVAHAVQPLFHDVIEAFGALTGVPLLLSTSFAIGDRPLVCTPTDAIASYAASPLDALALGPFLLEKNHGTGPPRPAL